MEIRVTTKRVEMIVISKPEAAMLAGALRDKAEALWQEGNDQPLQHLNSLSRRSELHSYSAALVERAKELDDQAEVKLRLVDEIEDPIEAGLVGADPDEAA